jgi:NADP-dependent 3-hydroxy acid dehydrogenase YdfG
VLQVDPAQDAMHIAMCARNVVRARIGGSNRHRFPARRSKAKSTIRSKDWSIRPGARTTDGRAALERRSRNGRPRNGKPRTKERSMSNELKNRVALVTGASSGIGAAAALMLAAAGARVAVAARRRARLEDVARRIRELGSEATVIEADFGIEAEAQRAVHETEQAFGRLDILVNNAGVMYLEPVIDADLARWRRMFEINVLGLIAATQAALPGMRDRGDGHIVNIASTAGRVASPAGAAYCATKFGVVAFSESLRKEIYRDKIRVSVIEPGIVETELREHIGHEATQKTINDWAASMRQLQADDVARAILYCVTQPPHVCINEILMRPTDQER